MKLMLHSNAPWMATGYGTQCCEMARQLVDLGQDVVVSTNVGHYQIEVKTSLWPNGPPLIVLPQGTDDAGTSVITGHVRAHKPDYVLSLYDACGMHSRAPGGPQGSGWGRFNMRWVPYALVDDGPPLAAYHLESLERAWAVMCLTRFAMDQLGDLPLPLLYAPHCLDPEVWKPGDKKRARARLELPQTPFLVLFCGDWEGWPGRKGVIETVEAFSMLGQEVGWENVCLMAQTKPSIEEPPLTLLQLREVFGIPSRCWKQETYHHVIVGRSTPYMVDLYRSADVLCLPSKSEAFGLTALEAEMCGTPTIVTNAHASKEVCYGPWKLEPRTHLTSWKLSRWHCPTVTDIYEAMLEAFRAGSQRRRLEGGRARSWAIERYSREAVKNHWAVVVEKLQELLQKPIAIRVPEVVVKHNTAVIIPTVEERFSGDEWPGAVHIVAHDREHVGFPATVNAAVDALPENIRWLLIWNDDAVPGDTMLKELEAAASKHQLVLAAPVVTRIDTVGGYGPRATEISTTELAWEVHMGGVRPLSDPWYESSDGVLPLGGSLYQSLFLVRRDVWEHLGGFDERYSPGYYEDADFIRRAAALGHKCGVVLAARCIHHAGTTFRKLYTEEERGQIMARNRGFYDWKFQG